MGKWDKTPRLEVVAGRLGFFKRLNGQTVPLGGLITLRNATLADDAWRTGGGAALLGVPLPTGPSGLCAIDYWPTLAQQRTVVMSSDGKIRKDDGTGNAWAQLATALTVAGAVPMFSAAGEEAAGNNRKLYYADRVNAPLFLDGDGAAMAALPAVNVDWAGANQPGWFAPHQGSNWAGGNANAPHTAYRSLGVNHGDFNTQPYRILCGPLPNQERTVGGISYKGGLVVFCFPVGVYFIDTTTDPNPLNWFAALIAVPGAAGPRAFAQVEEDIIYVTTDGSWHSLSSVFGQQKASVRASDISYKALTDFPTTQMNLAALSAADLVYYAARQETMLAHAPLGTASKTRRLHMDINNLKEAGGPNWLTWDRDDNEALFLRKTSSTVQIPAMVDSVGQVWVLDQVARIANGMAYTFEFFMQDSDLSVFEPGWRGRKKHGRFVQVEYVSTSTFQLTLEVWLDGALRQTIQVQLVGASSSLPQNLPFQLSGLNILMSPYYRLLGQFRRIALRGYVSVPNADCVITRLIIGAELAAG